MTTSKQIKTNYNKLKQFKTNYNKLKQIKTPENTYKQIKSIIIANESNQHPIMPNFSNIKSWDNASHSSTSATPFSLGFTLWGICFLVAWLK